MHNGGAVCSAGPRPGTDSQTSASAYCVLAAGTGLGSGDPGSPATPQRAWGWWAGRTAPRCHLDDSPPAGEKETVTDTKETVTGRQETATDLQETTIGTQETVTGKQETVTDTQETVTETGNSH